MFCAGKRNGEQYEKEQIKREKGREAEKRTKFQVFRNVRLQSPAVAIEKRIWRWEGPLIILLRGARGG